MTILRDKSSQDGAHRLGLQLVQLFYMGLNMERTLREKIVELKVSQSGLRDSQIAKILGCSKPMIKYHLSEDVRRVYRHRSSRNKKINMALIKRASGGKCCKCGYDKCLEALDFHHTDPTVKIDDVSTMLAERGKMAASEEAKKCILVCRNCHTEIHVELGWKIAHSRNLTELSSLQVRRFDDKA